MHSVFKFPASRCLPGKSVAVACMLLLGASGHISFCRASPDAPVPPDSVAGNLIQFNDNGAWTWYSDGRSVIDRAREILVVGSDASRAGVGGPPREGDVEAVVYDLRTGFWRRFTLKAGASNPGSFYADDHNTPGLWIRPDGKYFAAYAGHNTETKSYWRNFDGTNWSPEQVFDWTTIPGGTDFKATYSNPHYLSAEDRAYNFVRANAHGSPNLLISADHGDTWSFGGQLISPLTNLNIGYVSGYFKYCDNGVDRIDFIGTETHPRDSSTSLYHGYIKNGKSRQSDGTVVDENIFDQAAPAITRFTLVFTNGTVYPPGQTNFRCWNDAIQSYPGGIVQAIFSTRINNDIRGNDKNIDPKHAFFFGRFDGARWSTTYLCQAGRKLYSSEADYVGLGCLNPNDPNTIYISTTFDPRAVQMGVADTNQSASQCHEIWKGVSADHGASFTWTPVTQNSTHDNLRLIVPAWDSNNTALIWFRGTYTSAQVFDAAPVGLIERRSETPSRMTYVDATTTNTTLATGEPLITGVETGRWHLRTGLFNGGSLLASSDGSGEDAPMIQTTVQVPTPATYDVWVNFWGDEAKNSDWRIVAGLSTNQLQIFRQMACKTVRPGDHASTLVLANGSTNFLYQAYLGRIAVANDNIIRVLVDNSAIPTGTTGPLAGSTVRTWYDGISYARVSSH